MKEISKPMWECSCGRKFEDLRDCENHEKEHAEEEAIAQVGNEVWIDIGGPGMPSMMGGISDHEPEYAKGKIVAKRMKSGERQYSVEYDGERNWVSAGYLRNCKRSAEYVPPPPCPDATQPGVFVGPWRDPK